MIHVKNQFFMFQYKGDTILQKKKSIRFQVLNKMSGKRQKSQARDEKREQKYMKNSVSKQETPKGHNRGSERHRHQYKGKAESEEKCSSPQDPNQLASPKRRFQKHGQSSSRYPSTSQLSPNRDDKSSNMDIPGFYYDKEKKKYFKILPGQNSSHAGAITKETIKKKVQEETRLSDVNKLSNRNPERAKSNDLEQGKHRNRATKGNVNMISKLFQRHQGDISKSRFMNDINRTIQNFLQPKCHSKIFENPEGTYERLEHMHHMYPSQKYENQLICLWSLRDLLVQRIQTLSIDSVVKTETSANLNISTTGAMIPKAFSKITDMCSAPVHAGSDMNEYILYTTMCVIGNNPSMAMLRNLNCSSASDFRYTEFNLGNMATWCCAWNPQCLQFSIGTERHAIILDVETRRLWELFTGKDDVLTQAFSKDSLLLYSGTKSKGLICAHDLRSNSTGWVFKLGHNAGVCSVRVSSDDRYVYAADFNSKIKKWDIRKRKVVTEYFGHKNEYSVLPIYISEEDNVLYSAGQDCYTRVWDLTSGELRRSIPPPYPARMDSIPALHYSSNMTHKGSQPGLFMGIKDELHFYSL